MLKKTITYKDLDGNSVTDDFFFNLSKAELMEKEVGSDGAFSDHLKKIASSTEGSVVIPEFKKILSWAYGKRSDDGKRFIKSPEFFTEFEETDAYSELIWELFTGDNSAATFMNALLPEGWNSGASIADAQRSSEQQAADARARSEASLQGHNQPKAPEPETVVLPSPPVQAAPPVAPEQNNSVPDYSRLTDDQLRELPIDQISRRDVQDGQQ